MRDIIVMSIVVILAVIALRRPWVGVMLWAWISLMNPHRYTWGFAYDAPVAALAAATTLVGLLLTRDRESPFKGPGPVLLAVFMAWVTLSWQLGLDRQGDYEQWDKVMKIDLMILVTLALLRTKQHIMLLAAVCTASIALLGAKGGVFTIINGGSYKVWGPAGSFISDNNHFALALVMVIPLVRFLQMQLTSRGGRWALTIVMILVAAAAMGSHSRGGLLALTAMSLVLWWRGRNKFAGGVMLFFVAFSLLAFMPEEWTSRMESIDDFREDNSALGRFSAWWVSWRLAFEYPFGVGFNISRPELFALYSPYPELGTPAAHSIYFQVLGHHGFVGLAIFLAIGLSTWISAGRLRKETKQIPQAQWAHDLASMCQTSLVGYAAGGAFLSLAYFDLPLYLMVLVVLTRQWVRRRAWETETSALRGWRWLAGWPEPKVAPGRAFSPGAAGPQVPSRTP